MDIEDNRSGTPPPPSIAYFKQSRNEDDANLKLPQNGGDGANVDVDDDYKHNGIPTVIHTITAEQFKFYCIHDEKERARWNEEIGLRLLPILGEGWRHHDIWCVRLDELERMQYRAIVSIHYWTKWKSRIEHVWTACVHYYQYMTCFNKLLQDIARWSRLHKLCQDLQREIIPEVD